MLNTDLKKKLTSASESTKSTKLKPFQEIVDLSLQIKTGKTDEDKQTNQKIIESLQVQIRKYSGISDLEVTWLNANNAPTFKIESPKLKTDAVIRIAAIPERSMTAMQILQSNSEQQLFMPETLFSSVNFDQKKRDNLSLEGRYPMIAYGNDPVQFSASTFLPTTPTSGSLEKLFRDKPVDVERQQTAMKETANTADALMKMAKLGVLYFDLKDSNVFKTSDGKVLFPDPKSFCDGKTADARFDATTSTWYITGSNEITESMTPGFAPEAIIDIQQRQKCPIMQVYSEQLGVMLLRLASNNENITLKEAQQLFRDPEKLSGEQKAQLTQQLKDNNLIELRDSKLGDLIKRSVNGEIDNPNVIATLLTTKKSEYFQEQGKIDEHYLNGITKFSKIGLNDYALGPTITPTLAAESASSTSPETSPPTRSRSTTAAPAVTHKFSLSASQSGADLHDVSKSERSSLTTSTSNVGSFAAAPKKVGFAESSGSSSSASSEEEERAATPRRRNTLSALATRVVSSRSLPKVETEPAATADHGRKFGNG